METYSENQQPDLSVLLERAVQEGEVLIQGMDGTMFVLRPQEQLPSALDVAGIDLPVSTQEVVELIREGRERANLFVS